MHDGLIHEHGKPTILDQPKTPELKNFMDKVK
jgi:ABC-type histidine transport system ATPase subunit